MLAAVGIGLLLQLGAVLIDLSSAVRERRWPVLTILYAVVLIVVALALTGLRWSDLGSGGSMIEDPDVVGIELPAKDSVLVSTTEGTWAISLDACPGEASDGISGPGFRNQVDHIDVTNTQDEPYMRLHVRDRSVECLPGQLPSDANLVVP